MRIPSLSRALLVVLAWWPGVVPAAEVFRAGFETSDTPSYEAGQQIHVAGGQPYRWNWAGDDIGVVSDEPISVFGGSQGLAALRTSTANSQYWWTRGTNAFAAITSGVVSVSFAMKTESWGGTGDSFLECWVQSAALDASDDAANKAGRTAYVALRGDGRFLVYTNNSGAITLVNGLDVSGWMEIRVDINLDDGGYDVFLDDQQLATNLSFFGSSASGGVRSIQFKEYNGGASSGGVYLDDVLVSMAGEVSHEIAGFQASGNLFVINVEASTADRLYKVEGASNLIQDSPGWIDTGVALPGNGGTLPLNVTNTALYYYYRILSESL